MPPTEMTWKDVKGVIELLAEIGDKELKKTRAFFVPGFAKFVVIKKPATKAWCRSVEDFDEASRPAWRGGQCSDAGVIRESAS
jgi:hypothetical protein